MVLLGVMLLAAALAQGEIKAGAAAPPAQPAPVAQAGAPAAKAEKPKKVCIEETQMGSLFRRKTCATQAEWDRRRERDSEAMGPGGDNRARSN